jgi:Protein of unknown function (DUF3102)
MKVYQSLNHANNAESPSIAGLVTIAPAPKGRGNENVAVDRRPTGLTTAKSTDTGHKLTRTPQVGSETRRAATTRFSYSEIPLQTAEELKLRAGRIRAGLARHMTEVVKIGQELRHAKAKLRHGLFLAWVESEVGVSFRTAQLYMRAADWLSNKSEKFSHLPASMIYLLSKQATPREVVDEVVRSVESGSPVSYAELVERVRVGRQKKVNFIPSIRADVKNSTERSLIAVQGIAERQAVKARMKEVVSLLDSYLSQNEFRQIREIFLRPEIRRASWWLGKELIAVLTETTLRGGSS